MLCPSKHSGSWGPLLFLHQVHNYQFLCLFDPVFVARAQQFSVKQEHKHFLGDRFFDSKAESLAQHAKHLFHFVANFQLLYFVPLPAL